MKKLIGLFILVGTSLACFSQAAFIRSGSGSTTVYRSFDSVVANYLAGDTIYLPGGSFQFGTIVFTKKVIVYGAGHYPDSAAATGRTVLNGEIRITGSASGSMFQGFYLGGSMVLGTDASNSNINGLIISRCNFHDILMAFNTVTVSLARNIMIHQNVIRNDVIIMDAKDNLIENNIIDGRINSANGSNRFMNNVVFGRVGSNTYTLNSITSCIFENNIFVSYANYGFSWISSSNTYRNNVFGFANPFGPTEVLENNIFNATNLFTNVTLSVFTYAQNFHLKTGSVAIGAGIGGTDCGIYGGGRPYKEAAIPANPHVRSKIIADNTNAAGQLQVQATVVAQGN
jgi:hypothetical protein